LRDQAYDPAPAVLHRRHASSINPVRALLVAGLLDTEPRRRHDRLVPIYDYACASCDERFDELQRSDAPPPACPSCGAEDTQRLLSTFLVPNSSAGQRAFVRSMPSAHDLGCCGGGGCGTHNG
jgi:putative FmdB family regulatory protein